MLEVRTLKIFYNSKAVDDISSKVDKIHLWFLGPNGAGKTT